MEAKVIMGTMVWKVYGGTMEAIVTNETMVIHGNEGYHGNWDNGGNLRLRLGRFIITLIADAYNVFFCNKKGSGGTGAEIERAEITICHQQCR